jgi:hypothetical protein
LVELDNVMVNIICDFVIIMSKHKLTY